MARKLIFETSRKQLKKNDLQKTCVGGAKKSANLTGARLANNASKGAIKLPKRHFYRPPLNAAEAAAISYD
jgi:hypothetical protein